jgi:hypothetical protein
MRPLAGMAMVGLCLSVACSSPDGAEACKLDQALFRCKGNEYQWCIGGSFFGSYVPPTWTTMQTCKAPEVCKIGTNPELAPIDQMGCFEADSSCAEEGAARCALSSATNPMVPVDLWTCLRSSASQSLQWTVTRCDLQTPAAICLTDAAPTACYEVAGTCSSPHASRCEGNVLYFCSGPTIVDGKAVFDWVLNVDCAATGMVCRNAACENP